LEVVCGSAEEAPAAGSSLDRSPAWALEACTGLAAVAVGVALGWVAEATAGALEAAGALDSSTTSGVAANLEELFFEGSRLSTEIRCSL